MVARTTIEPGLIEAVRQRLLQNKQIRRSLPGGRIHIDRQLPFLIVYRRPVDRPDPGTSRLATGAAAYLTVAGDRSLRPGVHALIKGIAEPMSEAFGAFLIVELWTGPAGSEQERSESIEAARFEVVTWPRDVRLKSVARLERELDRMKLRGLATEVSVRTDGGPAPPGMTPVLSRAEAKALNCHLIGLEVHPTFQSPAGDVEYPLLRRSLQRPLNRALTRSFFEFARNQTTRRPRSYHALGRRAMVKSVWEADRELASIAGRLNLLLLVTPTNTEQAWSAFRRGKYERDPVFEYRPLPIDPAVLKRRLYRVPIERVEDPTVAQLLFDQRSDLDRKLTLLAGRETPTFLHDSIALYGEVDSTLHDQAVELLGLVPTRPTRSGRMIDATAFAARAEAEISFFKETLPKITVGVEIREDVSSLMVSEGKLLVGRSMRFPPNRVEALIQHEVGTHVLTFCNGREQPLRLLANGLAGYEALQEGLGVLAEYLTGGLTSDRMRLLAGRVVAVQALVDGATFVETFQRLDTDCGLSHRSAFMVAMRVHRGGGFTKDAVYLRGLSETIDHLRDGGSLELLLSGKMALSHAVIVEELQRRHVLKPATMRPRYLDDPSAKVRLSKISAGLRLTELVGEGGS